MKTLTLWHRFRFQHLIGWIVALFFVFCPKITAAQTITTSPVNSTMQISIGVQAMGVGTSAVGTDAVQKFAVVNSFSLRNDVILVPTANHKANYSGFQFNLPNSLLAKTNLAPIQFYLNVGVGPEANNNVTHVGAIAGGGATWLMANNVIVNLGEVDWMHAPGYTPPGSAVARPNQIKASGGVTLYF